MTRFLHYRRRQNFLIHLRRQQAEETGSHLPALKNTSGPPFEVCAAPTLEKAAAIAPISARMLREYTTMQLSDLRGPTQPGGQSAASLADALESPNFRRTGNGT